MEDKDLINNTNTSEDDDFIFEDEDDEQSSDAAGKFFVLIVDDEKNYLRVLSAVLEEEGYEVLTSLSGREALEIQETSDLDLTLTDMKMPGMERGPATGCPFWT